jgi:hypothetical protein
VGLPIRRRSKLEPPQTAARAIRLDGAAPVCESPSDISRARAMWLASTQGLRALGSVVQHERKAPGRGRKSVARDLSRLRNATPNKTSQGRKHAAHGVSRGPYETRLAAPRALCGMHDPSHGARGDGLGSYAPPGLALPQVTQGSRPGLGPYAPSGARVRVASGYPGLAPWARPLRPSGARVRVASGYPGLAPWATPVSPLRGSEGFFTRSLAPRAVTYATPWLGSWRCEPTQGSQRVARINPQFAPSANRLTLLRARALRLASFAWLSTRGIGPLTDWTYVKIKSLTRALG